MQILWGHVDHKNIPSFESPLSYKGCVRKQTDSPSITDKDFFSRIPTIFFTNAFFGLRHLDIIGLDLPVQIAPFQPDSLGGSGDIAIEFF